MGRGDELNMRFNPFQSLWERIYQTISYRVSHRGNRDDVGRVAEDGWVRVICPNRLAISDKFGGQYGWTGQGEHLMAASLVMWRKRCNIGRRI